MERRKEKKKCDSIYIKAHPITDASLNEARDSSAASWNLPPVPQLLANTLQQHYNCPTLTYLASSLKAAISAAIILALTTLCKLT